MTITVGLIGNPNCGKTTLFNALTGSFQRVGNWPGVTVEKKSGFLTWQKQQIEIIDLPGTYSLTPHTENAIDERIVQDFIRQQSADVIINILDASHLERHLYLTLQLLEMQVPCIIVLNMMDVARKQNIAIQISQLEKKFGVPVIALEAHTRKGLQQLKNALISQQKKPILCESYLHEALGSEKIPALKKFLQEEKNALTLLEKGTAPLEILEAIKSEKNEDADILIADARYRLANQIITDCVKQSSLPKTSRLDNIVLNRVLGIPIFLSVMYLLFFFSINIGGAFQDFFDIASSTIFVEGFRQLLTHLHAPQTLVALLANGVGKGINTTLTFIPVIGALFLFLAFLEDSGYMARAAFVVDRLMRALGLPGKSFVPLIVGFGCNVPAVMAARTLENKRDRILTIMMTPFMSCGARLAIYAVFVSAFFPVGGQNIVFLLYLLGIFMAVLTGFFLRKTILLGEPAPLIMELPQYHFPHYKTVFLHAWQRLKGFVFRAGKLILPICVLIGMLNVLNIDGTMNNGDGSTNSLLSQLGKWLTPIFAPMGIAENNWPATVGLVTGVLAKEVVVGTLNSLYAPLAATPDVFHFWSGIQEALMSIPENFANLTHSLSNPVLAKAPVHTLSQNVYGIMYQQFDGQIGAIAYLLFVLLYLPCISTTAAIARELNRSWAVFSAIWSTLIAYAAAVIFYQSATFLEHPWTSSAWVFAVILIMMMSIKGSRYGFARS